MTEDARLPRHAAQGPSLHRSRSDSTYSTGEMRTMNIRTIIPCLVILLAALPAGSPAQESERQAIAAIQ